MKSTKHQQKISEGIAMQTKRPSAVKIVEFDAGHRVHNHESKCATMHGHRYKCEIYARAKLGSDGLDSLGRVIDFSVIKKKVGSWIDKFFDHTTLVYVKDKETMKCLQMMPKFKEPFVCTFNPTAENIAQFLLEKVCPTILSNTDVEVYKIKLWETPTCFAEVELAE